MKKKRFLTSLLIACITIWMLIVPTMAYEKETVKVDVKANEAITLYVENQDGTPYQTMKMDGQGSIEFSFDEPGNYEYRVKQVYDEKDTSKTYDSREWYVSLFVSDNENGGMMHTITISDLKTGEKSDCIIFNNQKNTTPVNPNVRPPTGDTISSKLFGTISLIATGIALMLYIIYRINKRNTRQ